MGFFYEIVVFFFYCLVDCFIVWVFFLLILVNGFLGLGEVGGIGLG